MNEFPNLMGRGRQLGKTHAMAEAAKKVGAIMVCSSEQEASRVRQLHGIRTISIHRGESLYGTTDPVFFDPDAVALLLSQLQARVEKLQSERQEWEADLHAAAERVEEWKARARNAEGRVDRCIVHMKRALRGEDGWRKRMEAAVSVVSAPTDEEPKAPF